MARKIVEIKSMGDALRNTGYKNIESAVSEIIDNSVEADAKHIFVILGEGTSDKGRKIVNEIAFFDDGKGMATDVLEGCLVFGETTHYARNGIGRFGVGLPQSSLYACPEIEVYSWQNGIQNCQMVYLNINKVSTGEQTEIPDPQLCEIPDKYKGFINFTTTEEKYDFSGSGTLVIWKNCDRVNPKTRDPLIRHMEFAVGQKFRHFINEDSCSIKIMAMENPENAVDVYPNDPLFLMPNNYVLCDSKHPGRAYIKEQRDDLEPCFEPYGDEITVPVKYIDASGNVATSPVTIRFSIVKTKFYDKTAFPGTDPGNSNFGTKFAKRMEGISIVRANREIDFRKFDFYENINRPTHRWWGCEIRFMPELDELFGVANNKQHVELDRVDEDDIDFADEVQPVWQQLQVGGAISGTIKAMYKRNEELRENSRSKTNPQTPAEEIVNVVEGDNTDDTQSATRAAKDETPLEELFEIGKKELQKQGIEEPTEDDVKGFLNTPLRISYQPLGKHCPAFEYDFKLGLVNFTINLDHKLYTDFLQKIYEGNPEVRTTFELFVASFAMAVNETQTIQGDQNDTLVTLWNEKLRRYIEKQLNPST